jgi:hypothetical protein
LLRYILGADGLPVGTLSPGLGFEPAPHGIDHLASQDAGIGHFGLYGLDALVSQSRSLGLGLGRNK